MGGFFNACYGCTREQKKPGCHDRCPDYQEEKAAYEALKAKDDIKRYICNGLNDCRARGAINAMKRQRRR